MLSLRCFTTPAILLCLISAPAFASEQHAPAEKNFMKAFTDHIGPIWYANMESHNRQLVPGTVRVQFSISPKGKLLETRVLSNTSNQLALALMRSDAPKYHRFLQGLSPLGVFRRTTLSKSIPIRPNQALQPTAPPGHESMSISVCFTFIAAERRCRSGG
jgi:hypothetical protein